MRNTDSITPQGNTGKDKLVDLATLPVQWSHKSHSQSDLVNRTQCKVPPVPISISNLCQMKMSDCCIQAAHNMECGEY